MTWGETQSSKEEASGRDDDKMLVAGQAKLGQVSQALLDFQAESRNKWLP